MYAYKASIREMKNCSPEFRLFHVVFRNTTEFDTDTDVVVHFSRPSLSVCEVENFMEKMGFEPYDEWVRRESEDASYIERWYRFKPERLVKLSQE